MFINITINNILYKKHQKSFQHYVSRETLNLKYCDFTLFFYKSTPIYTKIINFDHK